VWDAAGPSSSSARITSVTFSPDNSLVACRADNGTVAVYRYTKSLTNTVALTLVRRISGIETNYDTSNVAFSPDSSLVLAGSCVRPNSKETSFLRVYKAVATEDNEAAVSIAIEQGVSVVTCAWPEKLNQVFATLSSGECRVFYDERTSKKGVTLSAAKKPRAVNPLDQLLSERGEHVGEILTPFALPAFADNGGQTRRQREQAGQSTIPERAGNVPEHRNASTVNMTMSMADKLGMTSKDTDLLERDPRAALLKYANYNPTGVKTGLGSAYDKQPKILAKSTVEEEQDLKKRKR